jgi:aryl-alcohol dehydrogenase-like predicted oxidoreductase
MSTTMNRRDFMALAAGAGAALMLPHEFGIAMPDDRTVPKRPFGGSGVKISSLCLGGSSLTGPNAQALMDEALRLGVDCWEIVSFSGTAFADCFSRRPEIREKVFLTAKVYSTDPAVMQAQLEKTLKDNGTSYVDFLAVHQVSDLTALDAGLRRWAENAKKERKIRFFGFCTHRNMAACLAGAAGLGWIDGIQTVYNYRQQRVPGMDDALRKCHDKGIGIFAIKSMALTVQKKDSGDGIAREDGRLHARLAARGLSFEQAKLQAIWRNPHVTSACSLMPTMPVLQANAAAAADRHPLRADVRTLMAEHADRTGSFFCRRCGACDAANADKIPIFDLMEMLMYSRAYDGMTGLLATKWNRIPAGIRGRIAGSDYAAAEAICPQRMPIAQLMKEASMEFGT